MESAIITKQIKPKRHLINVLKKLHPLNLFMTKVIFIPYLESILKSTFIKFLLNIKLFYVGYINDLIYN